MRVGIGRVELQPMLHALVRRYPQCVVVRIGVTVALRDPVGQGFSRQKLTGGRDCNKRFAASPKVPQYRRLVDVTVNLKVRYLGSEITTTNSRVACNLLLYIHVIR